MKTDLCAPAANRLPDPLDCQSHALALLSEIYRTAGLAPEHAWRSALADYHCSFKDAPPCPQ